MRVFIFCILIFGIFACTETTPLASPTLTEIPNPCKSGGEANLFVSNNGDAYLSWVEYLNDTTDALQFSKLETDHWSTATTIATGNDWFVNWADFPSLAVHGDGKTLAAHWLQKSAPGTYDYDVHISQSSDQGKNWSTDFILHRDSIAAEHGFVTLIAAPQNRILATWLDGRNTKTGEASSDDHGHGHGGAMSLRTAEFDEEGNIFSEVELDDRICDCCQTDAAMTPQGPIIVYRDRTAEEIRDISIVRKIGLDWTQARNISNDNWHITGCPVNGPAVSTFKNEVAVAWFTAANEKPMVKVIFSKDAGATFSAPLIIDDIDPLGRVDIFLEKGNTYLTWLDKKEDQAAIKLAIIDSKTSTLLSQHTLIETSAKRKSGFPVLEKIKDRLILAWTEIDGEETRIKTGEIVL